TLLPSYDYLVIDEAHNLEEEATRQFGFSVTAAQVDEHLDLLVGPRGLAAAAVNAYRTSRVAESRRRRTEDMARALEGRVGVARQAASELFRAIYLFLHDHAEDGAQQRSQLRVTAGTRVQPDWSRLEIAEENLSLALKEVGSAIGELHISLENLEDAGLLNYGEVRMELGTQAENNGELLQRLEQFLLHPQQDMVYWIEENAAGSLSLQGAPLRISDLLKEHLLKKKAVVLTGATLSAGGSFQHIRKALGLEGAQELAVGSPFDFARLAQVCIPHDMPEPDEARYQGTLSQALIDLARAVGGRTMALFTSHASLRAAAEAVRGALESQRISVLAQGIDGSPAQLLQAFQANPQALLLGTASFWEGVDLAGGQLQVVVLVRLPFNVPTEPVFAARSELFEDSFSQYALPQAILKFRQGFGRLIRSNNDRGVAVILDRRILSRPYGALFLSSLPPCTRTRPSLRELPEVVSRWLKV
ncbi:MAG: hypothetical protein HYY31_06185, partial [Chloroflexi bacterium]|nr:hypothetical protein [Chloroflexota bacterium]